MPGASMPGKEWTIPSDQNKEILLVFLRAPEKGRVKTRLARDLGETRTLEVYRILADFTLKAASEWLKNRAGSGEIWICYFPKGKKNLVTDWLGKDYTFLAQSGQDLGQRMANAMAAAFDDGADKVVLAGTDIPQIRAAHIDQAFGALEKKDVVLGASVDGGYWLVGFLKSRFSPSIFGAKDWGSDSVFASTVEDCCRVGLSLETLAVLQDVDTLEDLEALERQGVHIALKDRD